MTRALLAALFLAGALGCATVRGSDPAVIQTDAGEIRLEFVEWHEETSDLLQQAVPEAAAVLGRWGGLRDPVRITVVNSHWSWKRWWGGRCRGSRRGRGGGRCSCRIRGGGRCRPMHSTTLRWRQ